jgi:biopolymer transport protein ExbB
MAFYNYFQARLSRVLVELRLLGDEFAELLRERPVAPAPPAPSPTAAAPAPVEARPQPEA